MRRKRSWMKMYKTLLEAIGPMHWWPARSRFEMMIGAILTQNTAWTNVEKAISALRRQHVLSPRTLLATPDRDLREWIRSAGYFNQKSVYLKTFSRYLVERWDSNFSRMFRSELKPLRAELLALKGMGAETVDSILLYAGHYPVFVIDAYTKRIFSRHSFCDESISYSELQELFMKNLPLDEHLFNEYHALIVHAGKNFCHRRVPNCAKCPLRGCLK